MLLMLKVAIFKSGRGGGGGLSRRRAAFVDPGVARAEAGENFVSDGAEIVREFVNRDAFANQGRHMAASRRVGWKVGDVDGHQVHRDAADHRAALTGDDDVGTAGAVVCAGGAEI